MSSAKSMFPSDSVNVHYGPTFDAYVCSLHNPVNLQAGKNGDNMHPCFTPVLMSNSSVKCWPHISFVLNPSYNIFMMFKTAAVAEWLRAWVTLTMFEATVCGRS